MTQPPANRRPSNSMVIAGILILILAIVTVYSAFTVFQLPDPVTEQGERINTFYQPVMVISFAVFLLVTSALIFAVFRYQRRGPEIPEQIHGSSVLEMAWTIIPIIILVALFVPAVALVIDLKTPPSEDEADIVVEAVGHQWWWEFIYPDSGVRIQSTPPNYDEFDPPALVVPVGQTVLVKVRSTDVIHSFYAPQTLYKIQAVPGNVNLLHFTVTKAGVYHGQCYQFCGLRHSDMLFVLDARDPADYERWLQQTRQAQGLDDGAGTEIAVGGVSRDGTKAE
ncbi:MAG: cytochrome c oxidase subunit II [Dehalococcoidia bacterium]|nr:cytochrome c oxidase subunit II [Dehalococcoidia bacterium]